MSDFVFAFPTIADETYKHIQATGDARAQKAWDTIVTGLSEKGFTLTQARSRDPEL